MKKWTRWQRLSTLVGLLFAFNAFLPQIANSLGGMVIMQITQVYGIIASGVTIISTFDRLGRWVIAFDEGSLKDDITSGPVWKEAPFLFGIFLFPIIFLLCLLLYWMQIFLLE